MSVAEMSQTRLRAWLAAGIWTIAGIGFLGSFFSGGGPGQFAADSGRHLAAAAAVGFGFIGYWLALWVTRRRSGEPPVRDERDLQVMARANQTTLIIVLIWIFAFTVGLWTIYESANQVPVGWMWFLAYGSVILAIVTSAISTLILDGRMGGRG